MAAETPDRARRPLRASPPTGAHTSVALLIISGGPVGRLRRARRSSSLPLAERKSASSVAGFASLTDLVFTAIAVPVALFVWVFVFYSVFAFRTRRQGEEDPEQLPDGPAIEAKPRQQVAWLTVTTLLAAFTVAWGMFQLHQETSAHPVNRLAGQVIGQEWTRTVDDQSGVQSHMLELPLGCPVQFVSPRMMCSTGSGLAAARHRDGREPRRVGRDARRCPRRGKGGTPLKCAASSSAASIHTLQRGRRSGGRPAGQVRRWVKANGGRAEVAAGAAAARRRHSRAAAKRKKSADARIDDRTAPMSASRLVGRGHTLPCAGARCSRPATPRASSRGWSLRSSPAAVRGQRVALGSTTRSAQRLHRRGSLLFLIGVGAARASRSAGARGAPTRPTRRSSEAAGEGEGVWRYFRFCTNRRPRRYPVPRVLSPFLFLVGGAAVADDPPRAGPAPGAKVFTPATYNTIVGLHGIIMIATTITTISATFGTPSCR